MAACWPGSSVGVLGKLILTYPMMVPGRLILVYLMVV
mgnify:FL=1